MAATPQVKAVQSLTAMLNPGAADNDAASRYESFAPAHCMPRACMLLRRGSNKRARQ